MVMKDVVLFVHDLKSYSAATAIICRICHEEEDCGSLEVPCACSGSVKYAHRDCIQRWCNEKGNTVCEICLQKFEPGYTVTTKRKAPLTDTTVSIRGNAEVRGTEVVEIENEEVTERHDTEEYNECSSAAERSVSCCRRLAFLFTILMLARHLPEVFNGRAEDYPFTLLTVVIIKTSGILLPMYILLRMITAVHHSLRHHHQHRYSDDDMSSSV